MPIHDLRVDRVGDVDVIRVAGEIDLSNAHDLADSLTETTTRGVALDLTELSYIDSAGIRAVDHGYRSLDADGRSLVVIAPADSRADWMFRVTGLAKRLVARSLPEALALLRERRRA